MTVGSPKLGQVVTLPFIWKREKQANPDRTEGFKDRPCVVVAISARGVFVAPISHTAPGPDDLEFATPISRSQALESGLSPDQTNWVYSNQVNVIDWPSSFDRSTETTEIEGGLLVQILQGVKKAIAQRAIAITPLRD